MSYVQLSKAVHMAEIAHEGQIRKYTKEPYVSHPKAVATIISDIEIPSPLYEFDFNTAMGAILHDVVEDTEITLSDIAIEFGEEVAKIVHYCTKPKKAQNRKYNRAERTAIAREHYIQGDIRAQNIKMADMIHNCTSIIKEDPSFALVYLEEKRILSNLLTKAYPELHEMFDELYNNWKNSL